MNSALKPLTPSLFNAFPPLSNANKKVIDTQYTFMLFSFVYPESLPRLQTFRPLRKYRSTRSPVFSYGYKLPSYPVHELSSSFSYAYKLPSSQLLSFDILTNAPGVVPPAPPFSCLAPDLRAESAFANPLFSIGCALFQVPHPVSSLLATLTKTAGCIPTIPILVYPEDLRRVHPACPEVRGERLLRRALN